MVWLAGCLAFLAFVATVSESSLLRSAVFRGDGELVPDNNAPVISTQEVSQAELVNEESGALTALGGQLDQNSQYAAVTALSKVRGRRRRDEGGRGLVVVAYRGPALSSFPPGLSLSGCQLRLVK